MASIRRAQARSPPACDTLPTATRRDGHPDLLAADSPADVELALDVATFSPLIVGAWDSRTLHRLGHIILSDPAHFAAINAFFCVDAPPICTVEF